MDLQINIYIYILSIVNLVIHQLNTGGHHLAWHIEIYYTFTKIDGPVIHVTVPVVQAKFAVFLLK